MKKQVAYFVWAAIGGIVLLGGDFFGAEAFANAEAGWTLQSTTSGDWKQTLGQGTLSIEGEKLSAALIENSTAVWTLTTEPVWVDRFPILKLRYRARGVVNNASQPLLTLHPGSIGPVTPGAANLENPFANAGVARVFIPAGHQNDGEIHELSERVRPPIRTAQIDQITLSLRSGETPASLEILDLAFYEEEGNFQPRLSLKNLKAAPSFSAGKNLTPFLLPEGTTSINELAGQDAVSISECAGVPFQILNGNAILSTRLPMRGAITLDVHRPCREILLLMACDLAGTDSGFGYQPRVRVTQPERLIVKTTYSDGTENQAFPFNMNCRDYVVEASAACCYAIPLDASKTVETVRIEEYMSYGRIFLLGATLNGGQTNLVNYPQIRYPRSLPDPAPAADIQPATLTVESDRYIRIENHFYRMELDAQNGGCVKQITHKGIQRDILRQPCSLFAIQAGGLRIPSEQMKFESYQASRDRLELRYAIATDGGALQAQLTIQPATNAECAFSLRLENRGSQKETVRLRFPSLSGLRLSEKIDDDFYLFPRNRAAWGNQAAVLTGVHSGEFPLQFMDIYSETLSGGVALHTRDSKLALKQFHLEKDANESRLGIDYGFDRPIELVPQSTFTTVPTVLQFHNGDWRAAFAAYKKWIASWYKSNSRAREILQNVFICRRDYPIGGTGYLFDLAANRYTPAALIGESRDDLGGVDLVDISGWAYSEQYGRVGEYERFEFGGKENLRDSVAESRRLGVPTGLYLEGYLIDPRSEIGRLHGRDWQIVGADGQPKLWTGNQETFMCPLAAGWQDYLSGVLTRVARDVGADAVYMDEYGFGDAGKTCFSAEHGHPLGVHPVLAEQQMLAKVRAALDASDHPTALYLEQTPNDVSSQYADAAFDYSFWNEAAYPSPAKLNLFRFAFPSFKIIQLFHPGIDPRAASEEDAKLCFFYGEAMWLKGRARSWYSRECREFMRKAYDIYHTYEEAFASSDVEPMIPTEQAGLFANRFNAKNQSVVTLYNAAPYTIRGRLLTITAGEVSAANLWEGDEMEFRAIDGALQVWGTLHPHQVSCFSMQSKEN